MLLASGGTGRDNDADEASRAAYLDRLHAATHPSLDDIRGGTLTVMTDYDCWPLWLDGVGNVDPGGFVSPSLVADLRTWQTVYDDLLDREVPQNTAWPSGEAERDFVTTGRRLAQRLAAELAGHCHVRYHDERTGRRERIS